MTIELKHKFTEYICISLHKSKHVKKTFINIYEPGIVLDDPREFLLSVKYSKNSQILPNIFTKDTSRMKPVFATWYIVHTYVRCHIFWYITHKNFLPIELSFDIQFEFFVSFPPHPKYVYAHIFQIHMNIDRRNIQY